MESTHKLIYMKALAKLNIWDKKLKYYNFYSLHDLELYGSFAKLDVDIEMYFKPKTLTNIDIKFK